MNDRLPTDFVVRVLRGDRTCGVGTHLGNGYVLTASHVVNDALKRAPAEAARPPADVTVSVGFPFADSSEAVYLAEVDDWSAPTSTASSTDACLLRIKSSPDHWPSAASLAEADDLRGTAVTIFGYPSDPPRPDGAWSQAIIGDRVPSGLIQLDVTLESAILAQPGYSGAPLVVPSRANVVAGMFLSASHDASARDCYAATIDDVMKALPRLADALDEPSALRGVIGENNIAAEYSVDLGVSIVTRRSDPFALTVTNLLAADLMTSVAAARGAGTPELEPGMLGEIMSADAPNESTRRVLRHVLGKNAEASCTQLVDGILQAESRWRYAVRCAELLTPSHSAMVSSALGNTAIEAADSFRFDVASLAIEGLGRAGITAFNPELIDRTEQSDDYFMKLSGYLLPALARMFAISDRSGALAETKRDQLAAVTAKFVARNAKRIEATTWRLFGRAVLELGPWHADAIQRYWLDSDNPELVSAGARAIGHMRLRRGLAALENRLQHPNAEVGATIAREIGRVGGDRAFDLLAAALDSPAASTQGAIDGLTLALPFAPADGFRERVEFCIEHASWWADLFPYRAIGVRTHPGCGDILRRGLENDHGAVRGAACLALARVEGLDAKEAVETAHREASDHIETVQTSLALVTLGTPPDELGMSRLLYSSLLEYDIEIFADVVATLESHGGQHGRDLADAARWLRAAT